MASSVANSSSNNSITNSNVRAVVPIPTELVIDNLEYFNRGIELQALQSGSTRVGPRRSNRERKTPLKLAHQEDDKVNSNNTSSASSNSVEAASSSRNRKRPNTQINAQVPQVTVDNHNDDQVQRSNKRRRTSSTKTKNEIESPTKSENAPSRATESGIVVDNSSSTKSTTKHKAPDSKSEKTTPLNGSKGPNLTHRRVSDSSPPLPSAAVAAATVYQPKQLSKEPTTPPAAKASTSQKRKQAHTRTPRTLQKATTTTPTKSASKNQNDKDTDKSGSSNSGGGDGQKLVNVPTRRSGRIIARRASTRKSESRLALEARMRRHDNYGVVQPFARSDTAEHHQAVTEDIIANEYIMNQLMLRQQQEQEELERKRKPRLASWVQHEQKELMDHTGDTTEDDEEGEYRTELMNHEATEADSIVRDDDDDGQTNSLFAEEEIHEAAHILLSFSLDTRSAM